MAEVWKADRVDGTISRAVALKLPRLTLLRADLESRFARERDILARLEHPHIARLYDTGVSADGLPYLAMEYVDGQAITTFCDARRLGVGARVRLFAQVLDAVQYAHANLVIHRDLKPSNILVTSEGQVRLLDFGIAKLLGGDETAASTRLTQVSGRALTPDYASPEQILGEPLTTASDVYSLGVVLYELLAGRRPYRLKLPSVAHLEQAIVAADPLRPAAAVDAAAALARDMSTRQLARALAGDLDTIVLKALAKTPPDRYRTVAGFAEDLQRTLAGKPVAARPASLAYRTRKFVVRNGLAVGAGAAVFFALAIGLGFALWQSREALHQAARAAAVKDFLTALFEANSLEQADAARRGRLTAAELLEEGADRIGLSFGDQPALKAELQGVVGRLLHDLSLSEKALTLRRERAAALERAGAPARELAAALADVASTLAQRGELPAARAQLERAIALLDGRHGRAESILRASLAATLADLRLDGPERPRGEAELAQAVAELRAVAPRSPEYGEALLRLAELHDTANRTEASVPMFVESLAILDETLGPRSIRVARHRYRAGVSFLAQRRHQDAEAQLRAAWQAMRDTAGPDHATTAVVQSHLGRTLSIVGRAAEARALLEPAAAVLLARERDVDPRHVADALLYLGEALLDEGRTGAAGAPLQQALPRYESTGQVSAITVAHAIHARYLLDTGRYAQALELLTAARAQRAAQLGPDHPAVASMTNRIGLVHQAAGRLDAAEANFRAVQDSQPDRESVFGSPRHLAGLNLVMLDLERGRFDAALEAMRTHVAAFDALPAADRNASMEVAIRLREARALVGAGHAAQAQAPLQRVEQLTAGLFEHAPVRILWRAARARWLAATDRAGDAREELARARASLRAHPELGPHFARAVQTAERDIGQAP
jgi:serine/threonine-protein kinase